MWFSDLTTIPSIRCKNHRSFIEIGMERSTEKRTEKKRDTAFSILLPSISNWYLYAHMRLQPNRQFATESKSATGLEWHLCQYLEMCVQFSKLSICHRCMKFWLTFCLAHPLSHFHLPPCNANTIPSSYEIFFLIFFGHHLNKSFSFRACFYYCTSHSMFPLTFTSSIYQSLRFFFFAFNISYRSWYSVSMRKPETEKCREVIFIANILMSARTKISSVYFTLDIHVHEKPYL